MLHCKCGKCKNRIEVSLSVLKSNKQASLDRNLIQILISAPARAEVLAVSLSNKEVERLIKQLQFLVDYNKENPMN